MGGAWKSDWVMSLEPPFFPEKVVPDGRFAVFPSAPPLVLPPLRAQCNCNEIRLVHDPPNRRWILGHAISVGRNDLLVPVENFLASDPVLDTTSGPIVGFGG